MASSEPASEPTTPREGAPELLALLAGGVLAAAVLYLLFHGRATRFEELALGNETTSVFATFESEPIHCRDLRDVESCLAAARERGAPAAALWLGNSQLHAVNQWQPGDETAVIQLFRRLRRQGQDLVTLSQPNANLQEHLVLYAYLRTRLPLTHLLLPAVFDDTREAGLRAAVVMALEDPATRAVLEASEVGRSILSSNRSVSDPELAALDETLQEGSEAWLTDWLSRHSELWRLRPEARGSLGRALNKLRNVVFGIKPDSKRRLIEGRYRQNLDAARAILADAERHGIRVIVYVPPLRSDVETPYVASEYERFKRDLAELAAAHRADFLNLEDVVPGTLWGRTRAKGLGEDAGVDFMHFQAGGHAILAERLAAALAGNGAP